MKTANFTSTQSNEEKRHTHLEVKTCKFTSTQSNRKKRHHKENFDFRKLQILQVHKVTGKSDNIIFQEGYFILKEHKVVLERDYHKENFDF